MTCSLGGRREGSGELGRDGGCPRRCPSHGSPRAEPKGLRARVCAQASVARPSPLFLDLPSSPESPCPSSSAGPWDAPATPARGLLATSGRVNRGAHIEEPWTGSARRRPRRSLQVRREPDAPTAPGPNPSRASGSALVVAQRTQTPAKGLALATRGPGPGGDEQHGLAAGAGGCRRRGRVRGLGEDARRRPRGPGARAGSGGDRGCPLGLPSASELGASARAQLDSQGPRVAEGRAARQETETQAH